MSAPFPTPVALLKKHGLAAKKSWGQNFLVSERAYRGIVDAVVEDSGDWVVEFGAGLGTLTMRLAERVAEGRVVCVERDWDLVAVLESELGHLDNVDVTAGNALTFDLATVARGQGNPIAVCGNLPYQIASRILVNTLDCGPKVVGKAVFMVQREVADRLLASPGSKQYGALSVIAQTVSRVEKVLAVPAGAFLPVPKVASTVVGFHLYPNGPEFPIASLNHYRAVVRAAFGQRRKTVANALSAVYDKAAVSAALEAAEVEATRRAETMSIKEFSQVANHLPPVESESA